MARIGRRPGESGLLIATPRGRGASRRRLRPALRLVLREQFQGLRGIHPLPEIKGSARERT